MPLPKIQYPINEIEIASLNKKFKFRPILVREEKILLIAKQSTNENDIFTAIKQIVGNCSLDEKLNIDKLPLFELEHIFLQLRVQSIGNEIKLSYRDNEDNQDYNFTIDVNDIKIRYPEKKPESNIKLSADMGLQLRYPPASLYDNKKFLAADVISETFEAILLESIDSIYDEDTVYDPATCTKEELMEFIQDVDSASYRKIQEFFADIPHMEYEIKYTNKNGTERKINLRTLNDFFIL